MELGIILLSNIRQIQDKYHVLSHVGTRLYDIKVERGLLFGMTKGTGVSGRVKGVNIVNVRDIFK